jgi:uncharacterized membrane protein
MYWLFLVLALGAFVLALSTPQMWLLVVALLLALLFFLLWIKGLYVARFGSVMSEPRQVLHPAELQKMREQLQSTTSTDPSPSPKAHHEP